MEQAIALFWSIAARFNGERTVTQLEPTGYFGVRVLLWLITNAYQGSAVTINSANFGRKGKFAACLATVLLSAGCARAPVSPSPTVTFVVKSTSAASATATLPAATYTVTPTNSPRPSKTKPPETPSATPYQTRTPSVLLTPSTPAFGQQRYRLVDWTAAHADRLVHVLIGYPDSVLEFGMSLRQPIYWGSFSFAQLAELEALLRFPHDVRANKWLLGEAAHRAYAAGGYGGEHYRALVLEALNNGTVTLDPASLVLWFNAFPSILSLTLDPVAPPPGYSSAHLLTIADHDIGGSTSLLLVGPNGYSAFPLIDSLGEPFSIEYMYELVDLTADGGADVKIYVRILNGTMFGDRTFAFDLSVVPPQPLTLFSPTPAPTNTPQVTASVMLDETVVDLLAGATPASIVTRLQTIAARPDFEPNNRHTYYLGLAHELQGNRAEAVTYYLAAWSNCCIPPNPYYGPSADPFAIMARAKLEPIP